MCEEKLKKAEVLLKKLNSLELTEEELKEINAAGSDDINLNYINNSNDASNSKTVIFQKNVADNF